MLSKRLALCLAVGGLLGIATPRLAQATSLWAVQQQQAFSAVAASLGKAMFHDEETGKLIAALLDAGFADLDDDATKERLLRYAEKHGTSPRVARRVFMTLGPGYIKLGQILAGRGEELLRHEYQRKLETLSDRVEPLPTAEMQQRLESELGDRAALFKIHDDALGVGSVGQTHLADLTEPGAATRRVVVKLIKPGVSKQLRRNLRTMTKTLDQLVSGGGAFKAVFEELERHVELETDLRKEAAAIAQSGPNIRARGFATVPVVLGAYTAKKVLVEELVEGGSPVDHPPADPAKDARAFFLEVVQQIHEDGFVHGDPHKGNVSRSLLGAKYTFLDWGLHGTVTAEERGHLQSLALGVAANDSDAMVKAIERMAAGSTIDGKKLRDGVRDALAGSLPPGQRMQKVVFEAQKAGAKVPSGVVWASKALFQAEGLATRMDPTFSTIAVMKEYAIKRVAGGLVSSFFKLGGGARK